MGRTGVPRPPEGADQEVEEEDGDEARPERTGLSRTRQALELATPLVAVLLTLGAALLKLVVERLPTLQPIGVVLVVFLVFLGVSALVQVLLFWRDLATPGARTEFLRKLTFGCLLVGMTVAGMLARYFWELLQAGRNLADADPGLLVLPLLVSLMVFYPVWPVVTGGTRTFFLIVTAFQNGFFWQTLFSGLRPLAGPAPY